VLHQEVPPPATAAVTRTLPRDVASFTGRGAELGRLLGQLAATSAGGGVVGICAIGGMAGIGKTTLEAKYTPMGARPLHPRLISLLGEPHAWGRYVYPGEFGWE
jgi:hypothetical protein